MCHGVDFSERLKQIRLHIPPVILIFPIISESLCHKKSLPGGLAAFDFDGFLCLGFHKFQFLVLANIFSISGMIELSSERDTLRAQSGISRSATRLICSLVEEGRLLNKEILALGTEVDAFIVLPSRCPTCMAGEPELAPHGYDVEL